MMETKGSPPVMVSLHDVVVEMDLLNDEWTAYLNRRTGELVTVTDDDARLAVEDEEAADLPDWQQERLPKVREVLGSDDFLVLPDKDEINEYGIMEDFCLGLEDPALRDALLGAIRGSGAFRRFKDAIHDRGVAEAWYAYREQAFEEIAVEWLEANRMPFSREKRPSGDERA